MVLKKSNSGLNSGATQRVTRRGTLKNYKLDWYTEQTVSLTLSVRDSGEKQKNSITECLQRIWDRLDWNGPDLFYLFQDQFKSLGSWMTIQLGSFSTNKRNLWTLPERMQSIMKDTEFLRDIVQHLEVATTEYREIPNLPLSKRKCKISIASKVATETKPNEQCKKSRRRQSFHNRGIQRSHLFQRPKESLQQDEQNFTNKQLPKLDITIHHTHHVDARCANKNDINRFKTKHCQKFLKASTKVKGAVNGRYEELNGYTKQEILEETNMALSDTMSQYGGTYYATSNTSYFNTRETNSTSYDLCDFIVMNNPKMKRTKKRKVRLAKKENDNALKDLTDHFKYPRGSFMVIPSDAFNDASESFTESTWEILSDEDQNESIKTDEQDERQRNESGYDSHSDDIGNSNVEGTNQVEKEILEFERCFVDVTLVMTDEIKHLLESEDRETNISGRKVEIGRCHPPCFVVTLNESVRNECYLVGKKLDTNSLSWHVSFQCKNYCDANMKLQKAVYEEWTCCLKLPRLIELALGVSNEGNLGLEPGLCEDNIGSLLTGQIGANKSVIFCTTETAISYLTKHNDNFTVASSNKIRKVDNPHNSESYDCPVCLLPYDVQNCPAKKLLPCGHTFCVKCWQSQIISGIQQGANQFDCLAFKCTNNVDKATLFTLLPHNMINKWQKQIWGKAIEASPYCNWCPNVSCQNVALSLKAPLKTKFGQQVTCICGYSWCGGCKDAPHWPASCDQMAAYKKLLTKAGVSKDFTYGTTDFFIRLKPCPQCEYPIEKNEGCPAMVCRICGYYFCWNCLKSSASHIVYECRHRDETFVLYNLQNQLVHDLPLKYFIDCMEINRKHKTYTLAMKKWLYYYRKPLPSDYVVKVKSFTVCLEVDVSCIVQEAERCLNFIEDCYKFQERLYLLLGFAHMNKAMKPKQLINKVLFKCSQLQFVTLRLSEHILGKPSHEIYKRMMLSKRLGSIGEKIVSDLMQIVPGIQEISKDVDTKAVGEMDPLKYLRYK